VSNQGDYHRGWGAKGDIGGKLTDIEITHQGNTLQSLAACPSGGFSMLFTPDQPDKQDIEEVKGKYHM
jgi:hypothetical protein